MDNEQARIDLFIQIQAKIADRYNINDEDIDIETYLPDRIPYWIEVDCLVFSEQLSEELKLPLPPEGEVIFWRSPKDIINSYIPL